MLSYIMEQEYYRALHFEALSKLTCALAGPIIFHRIQNKNNTPPELNPIPNRYKPTIPVEKLSIQLFISNNRNPITGQTVKTIKSIPIIHVRIFRYLLHLLQIFALNIFFVSK